MDIYMYLRKEHKKVDALFKKVLAQNDPIQRRKIYGEIKDELEVHAAGEKSIFYKALGKNSMGSEQLDHEEMEHEHIKELLRKLDHMDTQSPEWLEEFKNLAQCVTEHIQEEERDVFKFAHTVLSKEKEKELVKEMESFKNRFKNKGLPWQGSNS